MSAGSDPEALDVTLPDVVSWARPRRWGGRARYPAAYAARRDEWAAVVAQAVAARAWRPPRRARYRVAVAAFGGGKRDLDRVCTAVLDALQAGGAGRDDCLVDALTAGRSPSERATRLRRSCTWSRSPTRMGGGSHPPAARTAPAVGPVEAVDLRHPDPGLRRVAEPGRRRGSPGRPTVPSIPTRYTSPGRRIRRSRARCPGGGERPGPERGPGAITPAGGAQVPAGLDAPDDHGAGGAGGGESGRAVRGATLGRAGAAPACRRRRRGQRRDLRPGAPRVAPSERTGASPGAAGPPTDPGRGPPVVQHRGSGGPAA